VRAVASRRPKVPIIAIVGDAATQRRLVPVRGVWPVVPGEPALAAPGDVPASRLLDDAVVLAALPVSGRLVVVGTVDGRAAGRIEVVELPRSVAPGRTEG